MKDQNNITNIKIYKENESFTWSRSLSNKNIK